MNCLGIRRKVASEDGFRPKVGTFDPIPYPFPKEWVHKPSRIPNDDRSPGAELAISEVNRQGMGLQCSFVQGDAKAFHPPEEGSFKGLLGSAHGSDAYGEVRFFGEDPDVARGYGTEEEEGFGRKAS